jgi:hypothetical protein
MLMHRLVGRTGLDAIAIMNPILSVFFRPCYRIMLYKDGVSAGWHGVVRVPRFFEFKVYMP